MRRKYNDCQRGDGNCALCSLVSYGRDCRNKPISKAAWYRMAAELEQTQVAEKAGVSLRQVQKLESGEIQAGNMTARNLLAIADALGVDVRDLIG